MSQDVRVLKNLTVLIVEDDEIVLDELSKTLTIFFKRLLAAKNGIEAYMLYELEKPDLLITDIKMPVLDGIELIKKIRKTNYEIPIILMSSYSEQHILLSVLNLGVDGYIIKPIELEDMMLSCLNAIRRKNENCIHRVITFKNKMIYNSASRELFCDGKSVELGAKERALLELFAKNVEKTISKEDIIYHLYSASKITPSALKGVLTRLRAKIGDEHIINVKGNGWKLTLK